MKEFLHFLAFEGTLLLGLFFIVTFLLVLVREQYSSNKIMDSLTKLPLGIGNVYAAVLGGITPFCSCSTVPVFTGMLRSNIRFGVSFTFLLASPLVNEIVVIILVKFLGILYSMTFVLLALLFPIVYGILFDKLNFVTLLRDGQLSGGTMPGYVGDDGNREPVPFLAKIRFAALISSHELKGVLPHLAVGLLIGGMIYGFIPNDVVLSVGNKVSEPVLIVMMALIGIPLYLNLTTALPIAFALVEKGIGIGPIIALLIAGAGTSLPEMVLLLKLFKVRLLGAFVGAVFSTSICMGLFFSYASRLFK
jgi:uncharacterized membrane protein YraQ (UPF0718 family)